jgi:soluble lytic murein transglycosylase-like protein
MAEPEKGDERLNLRAIAVGVAILAAGSPLLAASHSQTSGRKAVAAIRAAMSPPRLATNAFPIPVPKYLGQAIAEASAKYRVDPNLVAAMAFRESSFNSAAVSSGGAQGIMQLMPDTARWLGVNDSFDARQNVLGGTKYMAALLQRFGGDVKMALAAYNAGPNRISKPGATTPDESIAYVAAVTGYYGSALRALGLQR